MRDYSKITKQTPEKYCLFCGKKMERRRFTKRLEDMSVFIKRKYCSRECMRKAFVKKNGTNQLWTPAHHSARKIAYDIEGMKKVCVICGSDKNIDVHHKDGCYQNNSPENLMTVCRCCHLKLHRKVKKCKVCGREANGGHGYCNMHYIRWKKYGNPLVYQGKIVSPTFTERKNASIHNEPQQLSLF